MNRLLRLTAWYSFAAFLAIAGMTHGAAPLFAQDEAASAAPMVVRVYRVSDLLYSAPNYVYDGTYATDRAKSSGGFFHSSGTSSSGNRPGVFGGGGGFGGGMGGMGGGMGGGGGGGFFNVAEGAAPPAAAAPAATAPNPNSNVGGIPARQDNSQRLSADDLIEVITTAIEPGMWDDQGGQGSAQIVRGSLVVRQTVAGHEAIEALLSKLNQDSDPTRTLSVHAQWLLLNAEDANKLRGGNDRHLGGSSFLDVAALKSFHDGTRVHSGEITCLNGQTAHIISGPVENVIEGAIPVVGGDTPAYQPIVRRAHRGVLLQVTPTLLSNGKEVMADVQCLVAFRPAEVPGQSPVSFGGVAPGETQVTQVDREPNVTQQLATTLKLAVGRPTLVGGLSLPAEGQIDSQTPQLYLVLEINADTIPSEKPAKEAKPAR